MLAKGIVVFRRLAAALTVATMLAACSAAESEGTESGEDAVTTTRTLFDDQPLVANGKDEPVAVPTTGTLLTEIAQPELLARFEKEGYHFTNLMIGAGSANGGGAGLRLDNAALAGRSDFYGKLVASIGSELAELEAANPTATKRVESYKDRLFNAGWLTSKYATFELIAVVNRADRADFAPQTCGETRFVYRLSYVKQIGNAPTFSRLPFFFNAVYQVPGGDCVAQAKKWQVPSGLDADGYATWLKSGALDLSKLAFKQLELNAQVLRTPSESKSDMGGAAQYMLRIYDMKNGVLQALPLENTPDVAKITADPALKSELLSWIKDNVKGIDEGTAVMPSKFAATRTKSFTTFGSARTANKLFSQIYTPADFADADLAGTKLLNSAESMLFRLDDMTCSGCHQGRSVAGFHLLGAERGTRVNPLNALRTHGSPHYFAELARREEWLKDRVAGGADRQRPTSFHPPLGEAARAGTHCVLPDDVAKFRTGSLWSCAEGFECKALGTNAKAAVELGECVPKSAADAFAGLPCVGGAVTDATDPHDDRLAMNKTGCASGYSCLMPEEGTPGGMCVRRCSKLGQMDGEHEICAYGGGSKFDQCAASANFQSCLGGAVRPAPRQACDEENPCREDYMCQRLEPIAAAGAAGTDGRAQISSTPRTKGFCNPTYFIFQMRLDGHPTPGD